MSSPLFSSPNRYFFNRVQVSNSFSSFLLTISVSRIIMKDSQLNHFLDRVIVVSSYENQVFNSLVHVKDPIRADFLKCSFTNVRSIVQGGAIFLNNAAISSTFISCLFDDCTSTSTAVNSGGILIYDSLDSAIISCIFRNCSSPLTPSIQIATHYTSFKSLDMNFSVEVFPGNNHVKPSYGTLIGGHERIVYTNNNISHGVSSSYPAGLVISRGILSSLNCNQISFCKGNGFLDFYFQNTGGSMSSFNFINNTI